MKGDYSILTLCRHLEVSPCGYYDGQKRRACLAPRAVQNQALAQGISTIQAASRQTYGNPRILAELRKQRRRQGRNRIARLIKQGGLCGRQKGRYRVQTTDGKHDHPIALSRQAQARKATAPGHLWLADITYIHTQEGSLFLAAILVLYGRKIVGWVMSEYSDSALVLKALGMALLHRNPPREQLLHSDRGVQYVRGDYRRALSQAGLVASMSRQGNCYDNAAMESCWSTLKWKLVQRRDSVSRRKARRERYDYVDLLYNLQSPALSYRSKLPLSR